MWTGSFGVMSTQPILSLQVKGPVEAEVVGAAAGALPVAAAAGAEAGALVAAAAVGAWAGADVAGAAAGAAAGAGAQAVAINAKARTSASIQINLGFIVFSCYSNVT